MAKISPVSAKYIVHATIEIEGVVDRPDVIGAIFGQTEGLLGADLELRELQRSGRIGRIEVNVDTRGGKTAGEIIIPSSLDKAETAIVGAALEIIQRIGPCNAKLKVTKIEDVRISKRAFVVERAKALLRYMMDSTMPDSQDLADEVLNSVRVMECIEYGKDRLPAGPAIDESDEIIIVEGRADVLTLLKHGFKNAISMNGTSVPQTIIDLTRKKTVTAFVDGDRGGDLNIKELLAVAEIDFVTKAPDGKEVEELSKKEIHKCLRAKIAVEQANLEMGSKQDSGKKAEMERKPAPRFERRDTRDDRRDPRDRGERDRTVRNDRREYKPSIPRASEKEISTFKGILEDSIGTHGATILDQDLNILGKVPVTELPSTLKGLTNAFAVVLDGNADRNLILSAEKSRVKHIVCMDSAVKQAETSVNIVTSSSI
ncbi:DNA primase [Candidatus Woesearchaeota archaeon]|nr:MAG: DNA primase [archaeon GW2011_AR4]MBS3129044.1 DNA primase [Candidatus Woesearchaeota archaeon]HIH37778.1 DNA primase [Candidatus Woesearchaeota archaeon]HIH49539.1 DNA primase [Candidatus Woesearchaeota archaeon]HIJ03903.1 DNA primase [Candidatus Woesearchaeota archaeon]